MLQQLNKAFILAIALIGVQAFASAIINIEDLRQEGEIGLFQSISGSVDASRGNPNPLHRAASKTYPMYGRID